MTTARTRRAGSWGGVVGACLLPITLALCGALRAQTLAPELPTAHVPGGRFAPLYPPAPDQRFVEVAPFRLMTRAVTNADMLAFVAEHERFRRDRIARLFADEGYLSHWAEPLSLGDVARADQPVTRVSWFAAKAFCESHNMRLPTENEWEFAAAASRTRRDARTEPAFVKKLLDWYARPSEVLPDVPSGPPNLYGVSDLHGVIWEWVHDFNNAVVISDSRGQRDTTRDRFCGGGALLSSNATDYASFMRIAMRSSLAAAYTSRNLGFRCAQDTKPLPRRRP